MVSLDEQFSESDSREQFNYTVSKPDKEISVRISHLTANQFNL